MAILKAFQAIRPNKILTERIAALPYDVYNRNEAKKEVEKEPYSFLKIDRPETGFPDAVDTYDERVYQRAGKLLEEMMEKGEFVQDEKKSMYLYELTMNGRVQTGVVACASIDDYMNGIIKKHENTRAEKEADRISHVDICNTQTGPIFLAYRKNEALKSLINEMKEGKTIFSFISEDGITHRGWMIAEETQRNAIQKMFMQIGDVYIADGHHRAASAVKVGLKRRAENSGYTGEEEFNYFLSVLFSEEELAILDYNRVVQDLNGLSKEEFTKGLAEKFQITQVEVPVKPEKKGCFGMYLEGSWYHLTYRKKVDEDNPVESLDVSILQEEVLKPLLGIEDPKTDSRIDFVGGIRGLKELERRVEEGWSVAFSMYPTSIQELFQVADANLLMPPKSTWFEPKLRSGIFLHSLD